MAVNVIKKELPNINVIKVDAIDINKLAERCGVITCISVTYTHFFIIFYIFL